MNVNDYYIILLEIPEDLRAKDIGFFIVIVHADTWSKGEDFTNIDLYKGMNDYMTHLGYEAAGEGQLFVTHDKTLEEVRLELTSLGFSENETLTEEAKVAQEIKFNAHRKMMNAVRNVMGSDSKNVNMYSNGTKVLRTGTLSEEDQIRLQVDDGSKYEAMEDDPDDDLYEWSFVIKGGGDYSNPGGPDIDGANAARKAERDPDEDLYDWVIEIRGRLAVDQNGRPVGYGDEILKNMDDANDIDLQEDDEVD